MNLNPVVCVVNAVIPAILASILFKHKKVDVLIIEENYSINDGNKKYEVNMDERVLINCILAEIEVKKIYTIKLPLALAKNKRALRTWIDFMGVKREVYKFLNNLPFDFRKAHFVGCSYSTFLSFLPLSLDIISLDHGLEIIDRVVNREKQKLSIKNFIKRVMCYITRFNYWQYVYRSGYTLVNCDDDYFKHVCYENFENKVIERMLLPVAKGVNESDKVFSLLLPITQHEYIRFMEGKNVPKRELDFEFVLSKMLADVPPTDYLVVKFHPDFYFQKRDQMEKYMDILKKICQKKDVICLEINKFIGWDLSYAISAEIILKYINFSNVIGMYSTTLINVAERNGKTKCYNVSGIIKELDELMRDKCRYYKINPNIISIDAQ